MSDRLVETGERLADSSVTLARLVLGEPDPGGLSRVEAADAVLGCVSAWWLEVDSGRGPGDAPE
jgi:hypothetical protein